MGLSVGLWALLGVLLLGVGAWALTADHQATAAITFSLAAGVIGVAGYLFLRRSRT